MADTKISGLSAVTDVLSTDEFVLARSGTTKKITGSDLASEIGTGVGALAYGQVYLTSGDITSLSSTSFTDITGASVTMTTGAHRVRVSCIIIYEGQNIGQNLFLDLDVDGSRVGQSNGLTWFNTYSSSRVNMGFSYVTAALSAGSHTFKLKYRVDSGSLKIFASSTSPLVLQVEETFLT